MNAPRKPGYGGINIIESDTTPVTTSGTGSTARTRTAPIPNANAAGDLGYESQILPIRQWAFDEVRRAGIKPSGMVNSSEDIDENFAQRFIDYDHAIQDSIQHGDGARAAVQALILGEFIGAKKIREMAETRFDKARVAGVGARQAASEEKLAMLKQAVKDLCANSPTPMTAEEIRDFILERKLSQYSRESTLRHIKTIVSEIKKNR